MSKIIIITGPSGAGKSTIAKKLAETLDGTWALISQDDTRELIKAGYKDADIEWTDETRKQWEVSIYICCDMVRRYYEANINCVVELFAPPTEFEKWKQQLKDIFYELFVLLPDVEKTVYRNANRELSMKEEKIRENYEWFTQWKPNEATIIDTTKHSAEESAAEIKRNISHANKT